MGKKIVAVFLLCVAVIAAMHVCEAKAVGETYKACYKACAQDCENPESGYTFCEMKCDADCGAKEASAQWEDLKN